MTTPDPAAELRAAADKLHALALPATPPPWDAVPRYRRGTTVVAHYDLIRPPVPGSNRPQRQAVRASDHDALYSVAMHPGVGAALARLLDCVEVEMTDAGGFAESAVDGPLGDRDHNAWSAALAVAREINGGQP